MKKAFRIFALVLCAAILVTSLCSCQYLDEKKKNHAVYIDEDTISFRDRIYRRVDSEVGENAWIRTDTASGNVSEADVPVLLDDSYGDNIRFYDEEHPPILQVYEGSHWWWDDYDPEYFMREELIK